MNYPLEVVCYSIIQSIRRFRQLPFASSRIPARRVQRFMPENLGQADQDITSVGQKLLRHRVTK